MIGITIKEKNMTKPIILTGDRPTGKLHIGHYVGSLKIGSCYRIKTNIICLFFGRPASFDGSCKRSKNDCGVYWKCRFGLSCSWTRSWKVTIFIQSQIPELAELTMYYMNLVSLARLERNPTVKTEISQKGFGESIPTGFLVYPISQAAILQHLKRILFQ